MKNCLLLLLFLTPSFIAMAQERGQFYKIYPGYQLYHIGPPVVSGGKPVVTPKKVSKNFKYYKAILKQNEGNGDTTRVFFYSIPSSYDTGLSTGEVLSTDSDKYYMIFGQRGNLQTTPNKYRIMYYERSEIGVATMPFRYRFGYKKDTSGVEAAVPNDVSASVNVGLYIGYKWGQTLFYNDAKKTHDRWGFMISLFTGPTLIAVSDKNISQKVKKSTNEPGWQVGGGFWVTNRNVEVGVFLGTDVPLSHAASKWDYAYKPWLGFGLGYKLDILNLKNK